MFVITVRAIGEMEPWDSDSPAAQNSHVRLDPDRDEFRVERAFVQIQPTTGDLELWNAMDQASDDVAKLFAGGLPFEVFTPQGIKAVQP